MTVREAVLRAGPARSAAGAGRGRGAAVAGGSCRARSRRVSALRARAADALRAPRSAAASELRWDEAPHRGAHAAG